MSAAPSRPTAPAPATVPSANTRAPEATQAPSLRQRLGPAELEELYEGLIGRLRRELLLERERMGNLFGL